MLVGIVISLKSDDDNFCCKLWSGRILRKEKNNVVPYTFRFSILRNEITRRKPSGLRAKLLYFVVSVIHNKTHNIVITVRNFVAAR